MLITNHSVWKAKLVHQQKQDGDEDLEKSLEVLMSVGQRAHILVGGDCSGGKRAGAVRRRSRKAGIQGTHTWNYWWRYESNFVLFGFHSGPPPPNPMQIPLVNSNPMPNREHFLGNIVPSLTKLIIQLFNTFYNKNCLYILI